MVAAAAVDLISFCRRHSALSDASGSTGDITGMLPEPSGQIQKDYDRLVRELYDKHNETLAASAAARSEMSDYYAMWVHQIKTPIQAMRLLMDENEKNSQKGIELFRIEQYVEMALSYVRLGSEQTDYVLKEYDIDTVVRRAVRKYAPVFIAKKIAVDCRDTGIRAVTDEKWLQFVIEQLLSNSLKYTKKGSITIYSDKDDILTIEDTGIGIAAEDISRVTRKGFTGYNGRAGNKCYRAGTLSVGGSAEAAFTQYEHRFGGRRRDQGVPGSLTAGTYIRMMNIKTTARQHIQVFHFCKIRNPFVRSFDGCRSGRMVSFYHRTKQREVQDNADT